MDVYRTLLSVAETLTVSIALLAIRSLGLFDASMMMILHGNIVMRDSRTSMSMRNYDVRS